MAQKKDKLYTVSNIKTILIPAIIIVFISVVFVAVLSLLPNRSNYLGNTNTLGVGRNALFPFVFTDNLRTLYVLSDKDTCNIIDDSVYNTVHDYDTNNVYYLRNSSLYEYSIEKNSRKEMLVEVETFRLLSDKKSVVTTTLNGKIKLYRFSTGDYLELSKTELSTLDASDMMTVGDSHILFFDNYSFNEDNTVASADIFVANETGAITKLDSDVNYTKPFKISEDDEYVSYYIENKLVIKKINGESIAEYENAEFLTYTEQKNVIEPLTKYVSCSDTVKFGFYTVTDENGVSLKYFKGKKSVEIDTDISKIELFSTNGYCFYSKSTGSTEGVEYEDLYYSVSGTKKTKLFNVPADTEYMFDVLLGYLYYKTPDGVLSRVYIKDRKLKTVVVSETSGTLYDYCNRPYVVYTSADETDRFIVLDNNVVERYSDTTERYYGSYTDEYLIYTKNIAGTKVVAGTSLDLYTNKTLTRIANDVNSNSVYFDKDFNNVLYISKSHMYVFDGETSYDLGSFSNIKACDVTVSEK